MDSETYSSSISQPAKNLFNFIAAIPVVELPEKGSKLNHLLLYL